VHNGNISINQFGSLCDIANNGYVSYVKKLDEDLLIFRGRDQWEFTSSRNVRFALGGYLTPALHGNVLRVTYTSIIP
jgi:hypothetical protein